MTTDNVPATMMEEMDFMEGLEDFKAEDMGAPPRLNIEHIEAKFKVSGSGEEFTEGEFVILGMVRQRTMWHPEIPEGESPPPMCKSPDFENGFPEMSEEVKSDYRFPWQASNMNPNMLVDNGEGIKQSVKCGDCKFKEWGTDPKSDRPWCSEEFTLPILYRGEDGEWYPALWTLKRSSLKPVKQYMASFKSSKTPMFAVVTKVTLTQNKRGNVRYCTPNFSKVESTDRGDWPEYFDSFKGVRDYLKAFPTIQSDDAGSGDDGGLAGAEDTDDPWGSNEPAPAKKATQSKKPPAPKAAPKPDPKPEPEVVDVEAFDDDDEPPF